MDFVWWEKITNASHFLNLIVEGGTGGLQHYAAASF